VSGRLPSVKRGTLSGILADTGIDRDEFLRLLK